MCMYKCISVVMSAWGKCVFKSESNKETRNIAMECIISQKLPCSEDADKLICQCLRSSTRNREIECKRCGCLIVSKELDDGKCKSINCYNPESKVSCIKCKHCDGWTHRNPRCLGYGGKSIQRRIMFALNAY